MADKQPKNERAWWRFARSNTRAARKRRAFYKKRFQTMFPKGQQSFREMIETWSVGIRKRWLKRGQFEGLFDDLFSIHPDALEIIHKYGTDYVPMRWNKRPSMPEPKEHACFANTYAWAKIVEEKYEMIYVEGVAFSTCCTPTHHAWNAFEVGGTNALDWSWYAIAHWTRYRGIPLTLAELKELLALTPVGANIGPLFRTKNFTPEAEKRLLEILKERRRKARQKK